MPVYAFAYTPGFAFATLQNAGCVVADGTHVEQSQNLKLGCPILPSIGSAGHHMGLCKPCAFGDYCRNGAKCEFCHICKPIAKKKGGRWILKRRKNNQELQGEMLDLQHVLHKNMAAV